MVQQKLLGDNLLSINADLGEIKNHRKRGVPCLAFFLGVTLGVLVGFVLAALLSANNN